MKRLSDLTLGLEALVATGLIAALVTWGLTRPERPSAPAPVRFTIAPSDQMSLNSSNQDLVITPDGQHLVYTTGANPLAGAMWVKTMNALEAVEVRTGGAPRSPFTSPDGKWIGFFQEFDQGGELRKVSFTGGSVASLTKFEGVGAGGSWGPDGSIIFATSHSATGLLQVAEGGGEPKVLTSPDAKNGEFDHLFPSITPDGRAVLFTVITSRNQPDSARIAVLNLATGERKTLINGGTQPQYVSSGHLVYAAGGRLLAVRFDPIRLQLIGTPVPIVESVTMKTGGAAEFSVSRSGTLVYIPGRGVGPSSLRRSLVWVDRHGREEPLPAPPRAYLIARISPDGTRLALDIRDQESDIWTWSLQDSTLTRVTKNRERDMFPVWTRDSRWLFFGSDRVPNIYRQSADGTGSPERLTTSKVMQLPLSMTPDGLQLILRQVPGGASGVPDLAVLRVPSPVTPTTPIDLLIQTRYAEDNAIVSPDGRWLAYESDESGTRQIYVRPFPNVDGALTQVSRGGGRAPLWSPRGDELFFLDTSNGGVLTVVPVKPSSTGAFIFGKASPTLTRTYFTSNIRNLDIAPDGKRFLMIKPEEPPAPASPEARMNIHVVLNWAEELKARVPVE